MRVIIIILFLSIFSQSVFSQTSPREKTIDSLLTVLVQQQAGNDTFATGIFPSYRYQPGNKRLADDNIFFSGIIALRLMRQENRLPQKAQAKAQTIIRNVCAASENYKNRYGRTGYNFWRTNPVSQFPGDAKKAAATRYHIPDDADDSAILLLVNRKDRSEALALKKMLEENVPGQKRNIRNTLRKFHDVPAYSTWLGDRMPPEFDFCVMANILYMLSEYDILFTGNDWATVTFLRESFLYNYVQNKPHRISPQYKSEAACLYHAAFLLSAHSVPGLDEFKPQLIRRLNEKLPTAHTRGEALLLASALRYLKQPLPPGYRLPARGGERFPFFYANLASVTPNPFNGMAGKAKSFNYPYECAAWEVMLELELLLNE